MTTAVILGMGGLGCPAALAISEERPDLRLVLVDPDRVDRSNLARQILFRDEDVGRPKAEVAARRLRNAEPRVQRFDEQSAPELLRDAEVLLDGTDDFATRFLANDQALARGVPLIHGAVLGWTGQLAIILPGRTACLRCLFEGPPPPGSMPTCAEAGVLAPLCGLIGATMGLATVQMLDEKKLFFFWGAPEPGVLYRWDARRGCERPLPLKRDPACAACAGAASYRERRS